ncbi:MAG: DUF5640 domain-containing protein [Candidatus Fermentibacteraceae bacterium]
MRTLFLTAAAGLLLLGCGGGNGEESAQTGAAPESGEPTVVGTWEVVEVVSGTDMGNTGVVYEFNEDGTMCSRMAGTAVEGTYTVVEDTLRITQGSASYDACYVLDGESMNFDILNGPQTFRMELQH